MESTSCGWSTSPNRSIWVRDLAGIGDGCENIRVRVFLRGMVPGFARIGFLRVAFVGAASLVLAGCKSTPPPEPLEDLNSQQTHGHVVFQSRCAVCHYDRQTGPLHGPSLLGVYKKPALPSGAPANDERVTATIMHGHGMMPAMGKTMDPQDVQDVLAYLHTL